MDYTNIFKESCHKLWAFILFGKEAFAICANLSLPLYPYQRMPYGYPNMPVVAVPQGYLQVNLCLFIIVIRSLKFYMVKLKLSIGSLMSKCKSFNFFIYKSPNLQIWVLRCGLDSSSNVLKIIKTDVKTFNFYSFFFNFGRSR